jgi:hypothetical protein
MREEGGFFSAIDVLTELRTLRLGEFVVVTPWLHTFRHSVMLPKVQYLT